MVVMTNKSNNISVNRASPVSCPYLTEKDGGVARSIARLAARRGSGDDDMALIIWRAVVVALLLAVSSSKATPQRGDGPDDDDDNKPYKFGFNIENYQHRLEEKDTKGLIKGEYGFVTGDGVYHETKYATDENGDFKILGTRNYFVGLPGLDLPDVTKGARLAGGAAATTTTTTPRPVAAAILKGLMGCGSCIIPDRVPDSPSTSPLGALTGSPTPLKGDTASPFAQLRQQQSPSSTPSGPSVPVSAPGTAPGPGSPPPPPPPPGLSGSLEPPSLFPPGSGSGSRSPSQTEDLKNPQFGGLTGEQLLQGLLYRFNYSVGFHGHHERGDAAGRKEGGYRVAGRDGQDRVVAYTANEYGFQPNVTLEALAAEDTPREDTERDDKYGLRGYEFVWFNEQPKPPTTRPAVR